MEMYVQEAVTWIVIAIGIGAVLYLLWGFISSGIRALMYLALILCIMLLMKKYDLLPPEVSQWLDFDKIVECIRQKISGHDISSHEISP